jgi:hypothetical protein
LKVGCGLGGWLFWLDLAVFVGLVDAFVYEVCLFSLWDVENFKLPHEGLRTAMHLIVSV